MRYYNDLGEARDRALYAFLTGDTFWPTGAKSSKLKVVTILDTTVAFSYGEPIAARKPNRQVRVVSDGTLMAEMPGIFEWSMTTARHIQAMRSMAYSYCVPKGMRRKPKIVSREELHRFLGWPCDPLPAVVRANKCGANTRDGYGRSFPKCGSFLVDPDRPPNQWDRTYMGMYDNNPRYRR